MSFNTDPQGNDTRQGVSLRRKVDTLVTIDTNHAYDIAISIKHPWYRCQSLAKIAEHSNKYLQKSILQESFASAMMCHDENRRVEVACWPLRVAIQCEDKELAKAFLNKCISQITTDNDPISKWCAASVVNTIKKDTELLSAFFSSFQSATSKGHGWRVERMIKYLINDTDVQKVQRYIEHLHGRMAEIESWKNEHSSKSCS